MPAHDPKLTKNANRSHYVIGNIGFLEKIFRAQGAELFHF